MNRYLKGLSSNDLCEYFKIKVKIGILKPVPERVSSVFFFGIKD